MSVGLSRSGSEQGDSRSTSPYPPSTTASSDNEHDDYDGSSLLSSAFHLLLDSMPEAKLRDAVAKVASGNPRFQRALQRELTRIECPTWLDAQPSTKTQSHHSLETPPMTPTTPRNAMASLQRDREDEATPRASTTAAVKTGTKVSSKPRRSRRRTHPSISHFSSTASSDERYRCNPFHAPADPMSSDASSGHQVHREFAHHPGQLKDDVYEFVSRSPDGTTLKIVRTITMWSCCDEDEHSAGCVRTLPPSTTRSLGAERRSSAGRKRKSPPSLPFLLSSSSTNGEHIDETPAVMEDIQSTSLAIAKYSPIETSTSLPGNMEDVYPDSDLEIIDVPVFGRQQVSD